ncbi:hypothetical protein Tco_0491139 [Tanacetum coccineum]
MLALKFQPYYVSLILSFWQTASASTFENGEMKITTTIDERVKTITEASIRRHLKLEDFDGISTLPNTGIFEQLALMACEALETDLRQDQRKSMVMLLLDLSRGKTIRADCQDTGRMIEEIDQDARVTLVTPTHSQEDQPKDQLGVYSAAKVLADATKNVHTYTRRRREVSTGSGGVSTASRLFSTAEESVSTAGASMPVSTVGTVQEVNKDKCKGIMIESEPEQTKIKLQQRQERAGYEADVRLQD